MNDCGEDASNAFPLADNSGVLVEMESPPLPPQPDGARWKLLAPGKEPIRYQARYARATIPGGDLVVFIDVDGTNERFQLVHAATGEVVWQIPSPIGSYPNAVTQVESVGDQVVLLGTDVAAVDLKTGRVTALFQQEKPQPTWGHFSRRGENLYIVTKDEFFKVDPADIHAKRNGWR